MNEYIIGYNSIEYGPYEIKTLSPSAKEALALVGMQHKQVTIPYVYDTSVRDRMINIYVRKQSESM